MQRPTANEFDHASLEAMMERYRAELLRYQRATPPGKPTLAQNLESSERSRPVQAVTSASQTVVQPKAENQMRPVQQKAELKPPAAQAVFENKKIAVQPEVRRERVVVDTPPIMLPTLTPRLNTLVPIEEQTIPIRQAPVQETVPQMLEISPPAAPAPPAVLAPPLPDMPQLSEMRGTVAEAPSANNGQQPPQVPPQQQIENTAQNAAPFIAVADKRPEMAGEPLKSDQEINSMPQNFAAPPAAVPLRLPQVMPEQAPAPPVSIRKERAFEPVKTEETGCIAHTEFEKGTGAYGVFRPYERMGKYTLASFLQTPGEAVQTLVRFAADIPVGGADATRCRRSFTVKFFCREGEYDLFGMHLPVSVAATEKALDECCAASRANPKTGLRTRAAFWEFLVTHPEALHAAMWLYSDLGTIGSYRTIDGYGLPCLWINARGERRAVRPRWLSRQRPQTLTRFEAEELAGSDPDAVARDLAQSLQAGERPQYELSIQVIEPDQFAALPFDPFDPTAIWPAEQFKIQRIGLLTLERLPDDVQIELDRARFQPENIIPGIEHVPAPALKQGDDFSQVQQYLRSLGEFSRHRLIDNLSEELLRVPPLLLEQVLILFSRADLEFGQAMTLALGG